VAVFVKNIFNLVKVYTCSKIFKGLTFFWTQCIIVSLSFYNFNSVCFNLWLCKQQIVVFLDCLGDTVYSLQSRVGEGAYAKIYRIVPKAGKSELQAAKVIKVCSHIQLSSVQHCLAFCFSCIFTLC